MTSTIVSAPSYSLEGSGFHVTISESNVQNETLVSSSNIIHGISTIVSTPHYSIEDSVSYVTASEPLPVGSQSSQIVVTRAKGKESQIS